DDLLLLLLRPRVAELGVELLEEVLEVEPLEELLQRLGAHAGLERVTVMLAGLAVLVRRQELLELERRVARVRDNVVLEVDHPLEARGLLRQERAQAARHGLEEPD